MIWFLGKLWSYFGLVGIASVMVWISAVVAMLVLWLCGRRGWGIVAGLVIGNVAVVLARVNSNNVSRILPDPADREARLEQEGRKQLGGMTRPVGGGSPKADADARREPEGPGKKEQTKSVYEEAAEKGASREYRRRGKQKRAADRQQVDAVLAKIAEEAEQDGLTYRIMPEQDAMRADRWDTWNLRACRGVLELAFLLAALTAALYCRSFNRTFGPEVPLPLAGPWMDAVSPKAHAVLVRGTYEPDVRRFLDECIRKGETFVHFGQVDPIPWDVLHRLGGLRGVPKIRWSAPETECDAQFVLDAVWFGRWCCTITDASLARAMLDELIAYLTMRRRTGARALRTVNLVWHRPAGLDEDILADLSWLLRLTNFRLVVFSPAPGDDRTLRYFEQVH